MHPLHHFRMDPSIHVELSWLNRRACHLLHTCTLSSHWNSNRLPIRVQSKTDLNKTPGLESAREVGEFERSPVKSGANRSKEMEAVGIVVANSAVERVQGIVGAGGLSASSSGGDRRCCNVRLAGNGSGLSLHARRKPVELKSEKRTMNDAFVRPIVHRNAAGFRSSSTNVQAEEGCQDAPLSSIGRDHGEGGMDSLLWTGAAALIASLEVQGVMVMHAIASESESTGNSQAADTATAANAASTVVAAASRTPPWLAPAIVAFPLFSYFLFGLYRDKINPSAQVSDWLFILIAVGIVANIVLQVTLGVRLY